MYPMMETPNRASLSIIGLYNWDDHIFDKLHLPDDVDSDEVKQNILMECGELTVIYPDWDFMYQAIDWWSKKELPTWERVYNLTQAEYNPIENYDRIENEVEAENVSESRQKASQNERSTEGTTRGVNNENVQTSSKSDKVGQSGSEDKVAGFNTNTLATQRGSTENSASTDNTTGASLVENTQDVENTGKETISGLDQDNGNTDRNRNRATHIHGNIGVTTVAQMMEGELGIYPKINIVQYIVEAFKQRFCILVY